MRIADINDVFFKLTDHDRRHGVSARQGTVHEVNKGYVRVQIGLQPDGTPMLTPWTAIPGTSSFGGSRERKLYEKGTPVWCSFVDGDPTKCTVSHTLPSKRYGRPPHDDKIKNGESGVLGKLRFSMEKKGKRDAGESPTDQMLNGGFINNESQDEADDTYYDIWIADKDEKQAEWTQGSGESVTSGFSGEQTLGQQQDEAKKALWLRISESGGISGGIKAKDQNGKEVRFQLTDKGGKIIAGDNKCYVTPSKSVLIAGEGPSHVEAKGDVNVVAGGNPKCNKPWKLGASSAGSDGITNDTK